MQVQLNFTKRLGKYLSKKKKRDQESITLKKRETRKVLKNKVK